MVTGPTKLCPPVENERLEAEAVSEMLPLASRRVPPPGRLTKVLDTPVEPPPDTVRLLAV